MRNGEQRHLEYKAGMRIYQRSFDRVMTRERPGYPEEMKKRVGPMSQMGTRSRKKMSFLRAKLAKMRICQIMEYQQKRQPPPEERKGSRAELFKLS